VRRPAPLAVGPRRRGECDKKRARLNIITHLLSRIPYKEAPPVKVDLPKRRTEVKYKSHDFPVKFVPEAY
jgi:hypothetical protein